MDQNILDKAKTWLTEDFDLETRQGVQQLIDQDENGLIESFYKDLEFGTGGLRGIMGVGTNRMNKYTIGMASQGLGNYIKKQFKNLPKIRVAIAYDCRNNSAFFAETAAKILTGLNFKVYLFETLSPTPQLSYAVRSLNCQSGIVITASHNPKEYNGFKAYWNDGGQLIAPHDNNVIKEVNQVKISDINFEGKAENITLIGDLCDREYLNQLHTLSLNPEVIQKQKDLNMVYTPIHGTGVELVPSALRQFGFENIHSVEEQNIVDGNFPTVYSPNPEERSALEMAIKKANEVGAELVMATDPDADRVGIAVRDLNNEIILLNGNQTAVLLIHYLLSQWHAKAKLTGKEYIVKTIVTTELLVEMAKKFNVEYYDVLTGFKYIAEIIKQNEGEKTFIGGGEESYGYLAGEFVRDKDAVMACALIAEAAAFAKEQGLTLYEQLLDIYKEYGIYYEDLISVVKKGKEGNEAIQQMMVDYRANPPKEIAGSKLKLIKDYQLSVCQNVMEGSEEEILLPKSNVLQFFLEDETKISVRPSGTEPKIKFYISVKDEYSGDVDADILKAQEKIEAIKQDLKLV